ncbi:MAG: DUF2141 domain-containing protein [Alphaproteobacteria bacterium]|nr:DUF2141 domain-containing protein [Alphaproteobacteria bacterium]MBU1515932.1 DUF2141 domain-containing protein [Alphaproteobacteria bacterium]MBU2094154.1 DUF2141 domain-containing protein [Alphaproteobacteria bacterium]MBU2151506.1 DUF2141 domain-containing protein [Alphaproteobacteria bacterium]MBU2305218.1 DUF2141 domain-containing protein [Alphaproteobacteria bacterium]
MKSLSILAAAFVLGFTAAAAQAGAANAADTASLTVTFKGVKEKTGAILFTVVSEEGYDGKAPAVAQDMLPVSADTVSKTFTGLAPGRYAIKAFHDVNGDGKMGTNPFGMPVEPFAFSNNAVGNMGPAKWEAAAFEVKAGANTQSIDID